MFVMLCITGLQFYLTGYDSIPTDGSGRILTADIGLNDYSTTADDAGALLCQSDVLPTPGSGDGYLHPTQLSTAEDNRIQSTDDRGWSRNRGTDSYYHRLVRLKRHCIITAEEGVFTCHVVGDSITPVSVGIYYPSELILLVAIIVVLKCTIHVLILLHSICCYLTGCGRAHILCDMCCYWRNCHCILFHWSWCEL